MHSIKKKKEIIIGVSMLCVLSVFLYITRPQQDREWESGQEVLPRVLIDENQVRIEGMRDFAYAEDGSEVKKYITKEFSVEKITGTDVIISHFSEFEGLAHIFLSFPIGGEEYINLSVETRRETHEDFSPYLGVLRKFEIIYVLGMERDILGVRTDIRGERVYLYPTVATPEQSQELFMALAQEINNLYDKPKIYNTVFNNCTNAITNKVEPIADVKFPFTYKMLFPGFVDEILYDMALIDTSGTFEEVKAKHLVRANGTNRNDPRYSVEIRNKNASVEQK
jgi:hypothetical protein